MRRFLRTTAVLSLSILAFTLGGSVALRAQDDGPAGLIVVRFGKSGLVHRPGCPLLKRIPAKSQQALADVAEAEAGNFKPCSVCKPTAGTTPEPGGDGKSARKGTAPGAKVISTASGIVFSRDIAPILVANCFGCHDKATTKNHQLDMSTFARLMKGSDTAPVVTPNLPAESELLLRIKGESDGPKMPPGNNTIAAPFVARIEEWIKNGATLDAGLDPDANLRTYAPTPDELRKAEVGRMSGEQRDEIAETQGRERIKKAASEADVKSTSSPHFVLLSNLPGDRADALLKNLERRIDQLRGLLGPTPASGLEGPIKVGLYVFKDGAPYAEFVRGVENRELEPGATAHANFNVEAPYVVAVDPLGGAADPNLNRKPAPRPRGKKDSEPSGPDRSLEGLIVEQLATAAATKAGKAPRWLASGLGAYLSSQVDPRSRYFQGLRVNAVQQCQLNWPAKVNDALRGETDPDAMRAIAFSLMEWMGSTQRGLFPWFVRTLEQEGNEKLDEIIKSGWGGTSRERFVETWGFWVSNAYGRIRN